MKNEQLSKLSDTALVDRFRDCGLQQEEALLDSDTAKYNKLFDKMEAIDTELRARGPEARRALLTLLDHDSPRVRHAAAVRSLAIAPERSLATIKEIASSHLMPEAGRAGMTLYHLEQGIFKPT